MPETAIGFLQHLLNSVAEQGRSLVDRARGIPPAAPLEKLPLAELAGLLISSRGEASGVAIARAIMARYRALPAGERLDFLKVMAQSFAADPAAIRAAFAEFEREPSEDSHFRLMQAVEPPRQDLLRRLNLAPGNTGGLVAMREDLLDALDAHPELTGLERDFVHLFASWFNRGFLMLRRIDWSSPAHVLEKIIRYEAVHAIESWDDLRSRIDPPDRRCFAFFHPSLADEPLIFVEVALTKAVPSAIEPILAEARQPIDAREATTAVFYSISNCQKGLARISFGNFLIKQVVEELRRDLPNLTTFVTLSPVPGFRAWAERELAMPQSAHIAEDERATLATLDHAEIDAAGLAAATRVIEPLLARYFLAARSPSGKVIDPVARFHLGNGARLERLNPFGDFSAKGWQESYGAMVNYLYDLASIEENHEGFAIRGIVAASASVQKALRPPVPAAGRTARAS